jgi:type II restriction enzyme
MNKTFREKVIDDIFRFSGEKSPFDLIENKYKPITKEVISKELIQVGIMPEVFEHDSTEEKLWSKFSDIILAKSLSFLKLDSEVLRTRGNSADVYSRTKNIRL